MKQYSTKSISPVLVDEIIDALQSIKGWGSIEIFVQDYNVVQITERNIRKTNKPDANGHAVKIGT